MDTNPENIPAQRLPLKMDVEYRRSYARQGETATLINISLTGAFLLTDNADHLNTSDKVTITFNVSGRERAIQANIIWKSEDGCGVRFLPFNNRDVQIVDDLMYFVENSRDSKRNLLESIFKKAS